MTTTRPPRATLILLAYNQCALLAEAIQACFAQTGEPIEILLSDDASTDGSYELMQRMAAQYQGPHRVRLRRNERNLGIGEHYNRAIADSAGQLLVTAAGDDISLPDRVQTLLEQWDATGQRADLIASHVIDMSEDGRDMGVVRVGDLSRWKSPDAWVRKRPYVIGASHAYTRRLHERFGPFDAALAYEDQVMALRACCLGGGVTVDRPLLRYRRGGVSALEASAQTPQGFLQWNLKKHGRQQVLYQQIRRDLATAGRSELWRGKVCRSDLALRMLAEPRPWRRLLMALAPRGAGWFWALRHGFYFAMPSLAVRVRALQQGLKRRRQLPPPGGRI